MPIDLRLVEKHINENYGVVVLYIFIRKLSTLAVQLVQRTLDGVKAVNFWALS